MRTISSSSFSSKQSWVSLQSTSEDSVDTWMVVLMLLVTCLVQLYVLFLYLESFPSSHGWAPPTTLYRLTLACPFQALVQLNFIHSHTF